MFFDKEKFVEEYDNKLLANADIFDELDRKKKVACELLKYNIERAVFSGVIGASNLFVGGMLLANASQYSQAIGIANIGIGIGLATFTAKHIIKATNYSSLKKEIKIEHLKLQLDAKIETHKQALIPENDEEAAELDKTKEVLDRIKQKEIEKLKKYNEKSLDK